MFGISKQAYYKRIKIGKQKEMQAEKIKKLVEPIRKKMPRYGTKKLHLDIRDDLKNLHIKMGRDAFFTFARHHRLLVPRTKRCFITTDSKHFFFKSPNLIKNLAPTHSEQVFVNDITYIKLQDGYVYVALVTDLYSKKVLGYKLDNNMKVTLVKDALIMAICNCEHSRESIIHHSDRGIQYCCPDYSEFAESKRMVLSTTEKYDPYENAVAERINGILKYEFGLIKTIPAIEIANKMLAQAVEIYNNERRHCSLNMQTPAFAHTYQQHKYKSYKKQQPNSAQKMNISTAALSTNDETEIIHRLQ
ncbi:MAG: IS3 family transposase [Bacteroidetes bacterium]|nr:IS3 family transposase [Bacteroidota bacterium]